MRIERSGFPNKMHPMVRLAVPLVSILALTLVATSASAAPSQARKPGGQGWAPTRSEYLREHPHAAETAPPPLTTAQILGRALNSQSGKTDSTSAGWYIAGIAGIVPGNPPYNQSEHWLDSSHYWNGGTDYPSGWREDCSGFVSQAWDYPAPGFIVGNGSNGEPAGILSDAAGWNFTYKTIPASGPWPQLQAGDAITFDDHVDLVAAVNGDPNNGGSFDLVEEFNTADGTIYGTDITESAITNYIGLPPMYLVQDPGWVNAPVISSLTALPASLPSTGGSVQLSTSLSASSGPVTSYTYSVTPVINGWVPGTGASTSAPVPKTSGGTPVHYTFSVTATGPGGQTTCPPGTPSCSATVVEAGADLALRSVQANNGSEELFKLDGGNIEVNWYEPANGAMGSWQPGPSMGGGVTAVGVPAIALRQGEDDVDIYSRSSDGKVRFNWYNYDTGAWGGWTLLPGKTFSADPQVVVRSSNGTDELFVNANGTVYVNWLIPYTGAMGSWQPVS